MSSALMKSIGRAARQARRARKLTQEDVADRVGVSTQFYGRIERGNALPSVTTLRRMLEVLDLRADELLGTLELYDADEGPDRDVGNVGADSDDSDDGSDGSEGAGPQRSPGVENPRLRRLMRYLRRASPVTLETVEVLLDQIDKAGAVRRGQGAGAPDENGEPDDDGDDGDLDDDDDADDDEPAAGGNA
jgi:transcriptional regulator with XRE-family HTH domain